MPESIQRNLDRKFNLDEPWYVQYPYYVKGVFTFDLGPSLVLRNRDVNDIVKTTFRSRSSSGSRDAVRVVVGIPLGVIAALKHNTYIDYTAMFFSNLGFAVPSFLVATLLIYFFALAWGTSSASRRAAGRPGSTRSSRRSRSGSGRWPTSPGSSRGTMLETLQQDYVRTAKAKGLR